MPCLTEPPNSPSNLLVFPVWNRGHVTAHWAKIANLNLRQKSLRNIRYRHCYRLIHAATDGRRRSGIGRRIFRHGVAVEIADEQIIFGINREHVRRT